MRTRAESASAVLLLADRFSPSVHHEDLSIQFQVGRTRARPFSAACHREAATGMQACTPNPLCSATSSLRSCWPSPVCFYPCERQPVQLGHYLQWSEQPGNLLYY